MKNYIFIICLAGVGVGISGCASSPEMSGKIKDEVEIADSSSSDSDSSGGVSSSYPRVADDQEAISDERVSDSLLKKRLVYFDYDKSAVSEDYLAILEAHADFLVRSPNKSLALEGNTDDRGSNEYNLSLGQRRADAVRDVMLANGVSEAQIETLSFGEESPVALGQTEAAWAENRRVEIRYHDE